MRESRRKRVTRAWGLKCVQNLESTQGDVDCQTCLDRNLACTTTRPKGKRGRPRSSVKAPARDGLPIDEARANRSPLTSSLRGQAILEKLGKVYIEIIHPSYPFIDEEQVQALCSAIHKDQYKSDYILLLAMCAVGALAVSENSSTDSPVDQILETHHETYFYNAIDCVPFRIRHCRSLNHMSAFGLLALYSLRVGNFSSLHRYLALYHALVALDGLHDELRWPPNLCMKELETRRRLFWCMYRLEIHSACLLGHIVRLPQSQASVTCPAEYGYQGDYDHSWIDGWNYTNDLFRLIEQALVKMRSPSTGGSLLPVEVLSTHPSGPMEVLQDLKLRKPAWCILKEGLEDSTGQTQQVVQTIHITCTESLLSVMILLSSHAPMKEIIAEVEALLNEITSFPVDLVKKADTSVVQQLAGIGHLLHSSLRKYHDADKKGAKNAM
ncbi:C6 transcription factor [Fusarium albosuccineum]|uniref:C6 transcription factor n=1 Tax=Fusarium albosuccineum TaxID=1237068 RepID=A0A8H4L468_9HYPO|nr:C6 transcription factor [Fusarium albosuccineum]